MLFLSLWLFSECILDFSLDKWLTDMGHTVKDNLPLAVVGLLFSQLRLDRFQQHPQCSITDSRYNNAIQGWNNGQYHCQFQHFFVFFFVMYAPALVFLNVSFFINWRKDTLPRSIFLYNVMQTVSSIPFRLFKIISFKWDTRSALVHPWLCKAISKYVKLYVLNRDLNGCGKLTNQNKVETWCYWQY